MKTLGEFYREKILSLPKRSRVKRKIDTSWGGTRIEKDLFGWKLYYNLEHRKAQGSFECRSEEEARYLKVFLDAGMKEILIPKDEEFLKAILPELETLKSKIDRIINSYAETILDAKIRKRLKDEVWAEISK